MVPVFRHGELVYDLPPLGDIKKLLRRAGRHALARGQAPLTTRTGYYVDLSNRLWDIRHDLLINAGHSQIPEKQ